jgi:hypothetical protein
VILDFPRLLGFTERKDMQPPTPVGRPPHPISDAEKLDLIREMAAYKSVVREAISEADTFERFLEAVVKGEDKTACDWTRERIINDVETVMAQRGEEWEDFQ